MELGWFQGVCPFFLPYSRAIRYKSPCHALHMYFDIFCKMDSLRREEYKETFKKGSTLGLARWHSG